MPKRNARGSGKKIGSAMIVGGKVFPGAQIKVRKGKTTEEKKYNLERALRQLRSQGRPSKPL